jgi:hypothetical protein
MSPGVTESDQYTIISHTHHVTPLYTLDPEADVHNYLEKGGYLGRLEKVDGQTDSGESQFFVKNLLNS